MLKKTCFNIDDHQLAAFVWTHCQDGAWTDSALVIQSATAMFLGRNINIVGTSNTRGRGYTKIYIAVSVAVAGEFDGWPGRRPHVEAEN